MISSSTTSSLSTILGSFSTSPGSFSTTFERSPSASTPVTTSEPSGEKKAPLGGILGGTIGGVILILGIILLLCIYCIKKNRRKRLDLVPTACSAKQNSVAPSRERPHNLRSFIFRKQFLSRPNATSRFRRHYNANALRQAVDSTEPEVVQCGFTKSTLNTENIENPAMGSGVRSINTQRITPAVTDTALRVRQIDLEHQLRVIEQELRDMGAEPHRGPLGPNISPAILQTSTYI